STIVGFVSEFEGPTVGAICVGVRGKANRPAVQKDDRGASRDVSKRDGSQVGVRIVHVSVVCEDGYIDRGVLGGGGAVVDRDGGVVDGSDRNRDGGRAAALAVGRAVGRPVVTGLVGEGVAGGLAAVVAVAEGPVV